MRMKKSFILLAAAAAVLAGCTKTETVERSSENAIRFEGAYVGNAVASRAGEVTELDNDITTFQVFGQYGTAGSATQIFDNVAVTKGAGAWTYTGGDRLWVDGQNYVFSAYAPAAALASPAVNDAGLINIGEYTSDDTHQYDLIYAAQLATGQASGNGEVIFTFNHLLSWVRLTLNNTIAETAGEVAISDLKINGINTKATWTPDGTPAATATNMAGGNWDEPDTPAEFAFTDVTLAYGDNTFDLVALPQNIGTVTVTFAISLTPAGTSTPITKNFSVDLPTTGTSAWAMGNRYNYVADIEAEDDLGIEPIVFGNPTVEAWVDTTPEITIDPAVVQVP